MGSSRAVTRIRWRVQYQEGSWLKCCDTGCSNGAGGHYVETTVVRDYEDTEEGRRLTLGDAAFQMTAPFAVLVLVEEPT